MYGNQQIYAYIEVCPCRTSQFTYRIFHVLNIQSTQQTIELVERLNGSVDRLMRHAFMVLLFLFVSELNMRVFSIVCLHNRMCVLHCMYLQLTERRRRRSGKKKQCDVFFRIRSFTEQ